MTEFLKDIVEKRINDQEVRDWGVSIHSLDIPRFTSDPWEVVTYPTNEDLGTA
jgi:hypothetical protein